MKKIWKFYIMFIIVNSVKHTICVGQVTYENTYVTHSHVSLGFQEFFLTNLGNNDYKYVIYTYGFSAGASSFSLYNLDHSPFILNIPMPVVSDSLNYAYRLGYVSSTLFDCDSANVEYAIMLDIPTPAVSPNFAVYRTDGTLIFSKDSVGTIFCVGCGSGSWETHPIMNTSAGAKLFLFNYRDTNGNYDPNGDQHTYVYGLCGILPENITEIDQSISYVKVFPNPGSNEINFDIAAPDHSQDYELTIFNTSFQSIIKNSIKSKTKITIDAASMSSGTYFYSLQNKNKIFQTGKFVLSK